MKIGEKLFLGFVGITLLILVFGGVSIYYLNKVIENNLFHRISDIEKTFLDCKEHDTKILSSALEVFVQDKTFKHLFLKKDRDKLYNYGQPLFQNLKSKYGITHFYFLLADGHCFLRLHNKDFYGDLITRITFNSARDTQKTASGIELGKTALALRVVKPYYKDGELIGYVEFGEDVNHFLNILKGDTRNQYLIIADKKYLDRKKWKSIRQAAGLRDNWDDSKNNLIIADTAKAETEEVKLFFAGKNLKLEEKGEIFFGKTKIKGITFGGSSFELFDAGNKHIGAILSLIDITSFASIIKKAEFVMAGIAVILFIIAIVISHLISRSISGPIEKLKKITYEIGQGDFDAEIDINSKDEIGDLARSFSLMANELKVSTTSLENLNQEIDKRIKTEKLEVSPRSCNPFLIF